jgi:TRAP-type uncharacterized transport system substrate-binding protein
MEGKKIVFAGAAPLEMGTPWGTLALVVRRALDPLGYETQIESASWGDNNARYVADGLADLGATQYRGVRYAFDGVRAFAEGGPRRNLRLIATINQPAWVGMAVRAGSDVRDLADVAARRLPLRIKTSGDGMFDVIFDYYGLSRERILELGGRFIHGIGAEDMNPTTRWANRDYNQIAPWVLSGDFDMILDPIYAAYTPEHKHWWEATMLHDMRFLALPADLIQRLCESGEVEGAGFVPHRLMRGVNEDLPSVERFPQMIYTRDDVPEAFVYEVTKALDQNRHLFRQTHLPYSYDPLNVAKPRAVPFHEGALRYYHEAGYSS